MTSSDLVDAALYGGGDGDDQQRGDRDESEDDDDELERRGADVVVPDLSWLDIGDDGIPSKAWLY